MMRYLLVRGVPPHLVMHPSGRPLRFAGMKRKPGIQVKGYDSSTYEGPQLHELYEPTDEVFPEFTDKVDNRYLRKHAKQGELEILSEGSFAKREEAQEKLISSIADTGPPPSSGGVV